MDAEIRTAKNWYIWLWLSPLLTIPTFVVVFISVRLPLSTISGNERIYPVIGLIATLGSALWHLILLVPALNKQSEFVRWHGRQALLLAGIRTAIPVASLIYGIVMGGLNWLLGILFLFLVWLIGTYLGQDQASCGDCSLMRWTGHGAELPLPLKATQPTPALDLNPQSDKSSDFHTLYYQGLKLREQGKSDEAIRVFCRLLVSGAPPDLTTSMADELMHGTDENLTADVLVAIFRFSSDEKRRLLALAELEHLGLVEPL